MTDKPNDRSVDTIKSKVHQLIIEKKANGDIVVTSSGWVAIAIIFAAALLIYLVAS